MWKIPIFTLVLTGAAMELRAQEGPQIHPERPGSSQEESSRPPRAGEVDITGTRSLTESGTVDEAGPSPVASPSPAPSPEAIASPRPETGTSKTETGVTSEMKRTPFLGVLVERLDPALQSHLANQLKTGGILVRQVEEGSPAKSAGIEPYDILIEFGGQPITSPAELVAAVRGKMPNDPVTVRILRGGQERQLPITLGERHETDSRRGIGSFHPWGRGTTMLQFESLSVRQLDGDRKEVEYSFKTPEGGTERYTFQGTVSEIQRQVQDHKGLDQKRRQTILDQLSKPVGNTSGLLDDRWGLDLPTMDDFMQRLRSMHEMLENGRSIY